MSSHSNGDPGTTLPTTTPNDASSSLSISAQIQIHRGAIDQTMITTQPPLSVMQHIHSMLLALGVGVQTESTFRLRCIRPIRKLNDNDNEEGTKNTDTGNVQDLEDTTGSVPETTSLAAKAKEDQGEEEDDPKTPTQAHPQLPLSSSSSAPSPPSPTTTTTSKPPSRSGCSLYGPTTSDDPAGEVRFSIELTKLAGLSDTYSLDIRRLKGHLRSYKYIYDTLRDRAELNR